MDTSGSKNQPHIIAAHTDDESEIIELCTAGAQRRGLIEEISNSASPTKTSSRSAPARKGTSDYSKWDKIDSDNEDEMPQPGNNLKNMFPSVPNIKRNDPRVKQALEDRRVQEFLTTLRTSADDKSIHRILEDKDISQKIQLLVAAGVVDIRPPS
jgi:hypothetical protein